MAGKLFQSLGGNKDMTYNAAEQETIGLCIALEAVGDIVNHALLELRDVRSLPGETEVYFHSHVHEQLFLIRLLDFAKEGGDRSLTGVTGSCLAVLQSACGNKSFDIDGSVNDLVESVTALDDWLNNQDNISLWLPTLDIDANIEVSRLNLLTITANQSKHNLSRLTGVSRCIKRILEDNGYNVPLESIPLSLEDFQEHLQENYFIYYGTWLAELLSNIRWGIQTYLTPTFRLSFETKPPDHVAYSYNYPTSIQHDLARSWFWRLMNNIRTGPYMKKFTGAHYLKERSSIE